MGKIHYKNLHVKERRFRVKGNFHVHGNSYLEDELIHKDVHIAEFMILNSADTFIEREKEKRKLQLKREEAKIARSGNTGVTSP